MEQIIKELIKLAIKQEKINKEIKKLMEEKI
jgi:hypothetical protein